MIDVHDDAPRNRGALGSERVRLARLARDAALRVPGVADTESGTAGLFVTAGGGERVPGVTCVAAQAGGYDVMLRLRCELVPLLELGDHVIVAVRQAAGTAAGSAAVAGLRVEIVDVVDPRGA